MKTNTEWTTAVTYAGGTVEHWTCDSRADARRLAESLAGNDGITSVEPVSRPAATEGASPEPWEAS